MDSGDGLWRFGTLIDQLGGLIRKGSYRMISPRLQLDGG
jgi:hypothetical protein